MLDLVFFLLITICFVFNPFLNWICLSILSLNILFHFIFMSNLINYLIYCYLFCFISFFYWNFPFQFHPSIFYWSGFWFHNFFGFAFYGVILTPWLGSWVLKVSPGWLRFLFQVIFTIVFLQSHSSILDLLGLCFVIFLQGYPDLIYYWVAG
jgi:hypothetical protein